MAVIKNKSLGHVNAIQSEATIVSAGHCERSVRSNLGSSPELIFTTFAMTVVIKTELCETGSALVGKDYWGSEVR